MTQIKDIVGREIKQGDTVVAMAWGWTSIMKEYQVTGFTGGGNVKVLGSQTYSNNFTVEIKTWARPEECVVVTKE